MFQLLYEEVLSHNTLLETIAAKSANIAENYVAQLELQDLQERYNTVKDNAMVTSSRKCTLRGSESYLRCISALVL